MRLRRISELSDSDSDDSNDDDEPTYAFPELDCEIRRVLAKYDGAVFPKLNWSSPQVRTHTLTLTLAHFTC